MLCTDARFFVQFDAESDRRILHPANVKSRADGVFTVEFEEVIPAPDAGQSVLIFCETRRKFMKQPASIDAVIQSDGCPIVGLTLKGEPVPAENRECYRVSTIGAGLTIQFGAESRAELLDVSATGFSVVTHERLGVGDEVEASIVHDAARYTGRACVQSVRDVGQDQWRYGVVCLKEDRAQSALQNGLNKVCMTVQRHQLGRLSRSG